VIERAVVLNSGNFIDLKDLPVEFTKAKGIWTSIGLSRRRRRFRALWRKSRRSSSAGHSKRAEMFRSHAADQLGITKSLIQHKMKKYNISV